MLDGSAGRRFLCAAMSSDDEPDWLVEQDSARKAAAQRSAVDSDDSLSVDDAGSYADEEVGASQETDEPKPKAKGKGRAPPSSVLPLQLAPKVRRDMLLLEADDSALDFSGDFGVIGKMHLRKGSSSTGAAGSSQGDGDGAVADMRQTAMFDLKGKVYDADIIPCNSLCLLQVDGNKAKIEAVFGDFLQLSAPRDSIFDAQEVSHGELGEGFFEDEVLSNVDGGSDDEEELGPLREGGAKKSKGGGRKPTAKRAKGTGVGAKRKPAGGTAKPAAKKQKK